MRNYSSVVLSFPEWRLQHVEEGEQLFSDTRMKAEVSRKATSLSFNPMKWISFRSSHPEKYYWSCLEALVVMF
jgi:hypothetical protein